MEELEGKGRMGKDFEDIKSFTVSGYGLFSGEMLIPLKCGCVRY